MNGILFLSEAQRRWRTNGYSDGRAGRTPKRLSEEYLAGYRAGQSYLLRATTIEAAQAVGKRRV
jgi:hypothetical protein